MATILYPALQQPPGTLPAPSFDWQRPLSEPTRRIGLAVALIASGLVAAPFVEPPPAETVTVDKWFASFTQPSRVRIWQPIQVSGSVDFPAVQPATDAANVNWFARLSEPVRFPRDPRFRATLAASGMPDWPVNQPATDNANVRWHRPFAEPVRYPRDPRFNASLAASGMPLWPFAQPAVDQRTVAWHRPFAEPVRYPRDPRYLATFGKLGDTAWPTAQPADDNANVRWHAPFSEPKRWLRNGPKAAASLAASGETPRSISAFVDDNANARWFQPFSEPKRWLRQGREYNATLTNGFYASARLADVPIFDYGLGTIVYQPPSFFNKTSGRYLAAFSAGEFSSPSVTAWFVAPVVPVAAEFPVNIDMRSGFKTPPRELVREWTGLMVRYDNLDLRHPQDFVKGTRDRQGVANARPEADDTFLAANDVTPDDL